MRPTMRPIWLKRSLFSFLFSVLYSLTTNYGPYL